LRENNDKQQKLENSLSVNNCNDKRQQQLQKLFIFIKAIEFGKIVPDEDNQNFIIFHNVILLFC
jgi:hypothetical protein